MNSGLRVDGLDLVQANIQRVLRGLPREQKSIHGVLGEDILTRARGRARVRTGRLRSLIQLRTTSEQVEVTSEADYARFPHYGTRYISADLHLTEPLRELEGKLVNDYQKLVDRYVDKTWRSSA